MPAPRRVGKTGGRSPTGAATNAPSVGSQTVAVPHPGRCQRSGLAVRSRAASCSARSTLVVRPGTSTFSTVILSGRPCRAAARAFAGFMVPSA